MAVRLGEEISVAILIGDEEVVAIFPGYANTEMAAAIKTLSTGRLTTGRGGQPKDQTFDARIRFFNTMCVRVINVEDENGAPLTPDTENWRRLIPANWKTSFSIFFEEKATLTNEDVGN
jgi:hypothetical protein